MDFIYLPCVHSPSRKGFDDITKGDPIKGPINQVAAPSHDTQSHPPLPSELPLRHTDLFSRSQDQALFSHFPSSHLTDGEKIKLIDTGDGSDPPGPISAIVLVSEDFNCGLNLFLLKGFGFFWPLYCFGAVARSAGPESR